MTKESIKKLALLGLCIYCIWLFSNIFYQHGNHQWDFRTYYYAVHAYLAGLNPYDTNILSRVAHTNIQLRYVYTPVTLILFRSLALVSYDTAYLIFLFLKIISLAGLLYLWKKEFLKEDMDIPFYFFCLLAFNNAIYMDISAGNISIFEQIFLWLGFYSFLKRKYTQFILFVLIASLFKLTPAFFLILLLFSEDKKKYAYFSISVFIFFAILGISYLSTPDLFKQFIQNAYTLDERGIYRNSASFALLKDGFDYWAKQTGWQVWHITQSLVFLVIAIVIAAISWQAYRKFLTVQKEDKEKLLIYLVCIVYALIMPRFKDYSYILLLVPTYFIFKKSENKNTFIFLFIISIISPGNIYLPGLKFLYISLLSYYPLFLAFGIWVLYIFKFRNSDF